MAAKLKEYDGASPAKIFIGGLAKETTMETFEEHFGKYGKIIDAVIMKDRYTGKPRGFGFITYDDPSVVDKVIEDTHVINGKQVEIKRTIPKGAAPLKDFKTKKVFVGGIPTTLTEDEFKNFFSKFGKVVDHEIIRDHATSRSRGFGFVVFDSEKTVDELLAKKGNMIDLAGTQRSSAVQPSRCSPPTPPPPPPPSPPRSSPPPHPVVVVVVSPTVGEVGGAQGAASPSGRVKRDAPREQVNARRPMGACHMAAPLTSR